MNEGVAQRFQEAVWALEQAGARLRLAAYALQHAGLVSVAAQVSHWEDDVARQLTELTWDLVRG